MDADIRQSLRASIEKNDRLQAWKNLETTQEFLAPLREKLKDLKDISFEDIVKFDDKSFRSKVEAQFLAAKEIEDYFAYLDSIETEAKSAVEALEGKNVETY